LGFHPRILVTWWLGLLGLPNRPLRQRHKRRLGNIAAGRNMETKAGIVGPVRQLSSHGGKKGWASSGKKGWASSNTTNLAPALFVLDRAREALDCLAIVFLGPAMVAPMRTINRCKTWWLAAGAETGCWGVAPLRAHFSPPTALKFPRSVAFSRKRGSWNTALSG
jgi:hypothetical protein